MGDNRGLYGKYRVERVDGKPIAAAFVLEYYKDKAARAALLAYAGACEDQNPKLSRDLRTMVERAQIHAELMGREE